ncbi:hypothetical protein AVEN_14877-1 [Araneus ventricosus]|uniref:Uncharacterized protein n=1 Tax=Araneus ventricosus TaxID=182803 RepID=A0A4Y2F8T1_ARAVE|nr:hypothetical protein AVEN_14877-1 [Araneus ventricosus]
MEVSSGPNKKMILMKSQPTFPKRIIMPGATLTQICRKLENRQNAKRRYIEDMIPHSKRTMRMKRDQKSNRYEPKKLCKTFGLLRTSTRYRAESFDKLYSNELFIERMLEKKIITLNNFFEKA